MQCLVLVSGVTCVTQEWPCMWSLGSEKASALCEGVCQMDPQDSEKHDAGWVCPQAVSSSSLVKPIKLKQKTGAWQELII